jgi:hypothetical protein
MDETVGETLHENPGGDFIGEGEDGICDLIQIGLKLCLPLLQRVDIRF